MSDECKRCQAASELLRVWDEVEVPVPPAVIAEARRILDGREMK